jgi:hypothetical protein
VPFGTIQTGLFANPTFAKVLFKYPIKRTAIHRSGVHKFGDFSEQRYVQGIPLVELDIQFPEIPVSWKETLRLFYNNALGSARSWSTNIDGIGYYNCRFLSAFEATEVSQGLWNVGVRARGLAQGTVTPTAQGAGAIVLVPAAAGSVDVAWNVAWNVLPTNASFTNGTVRVTFDGSGGATILYIAGSGGEDVIEGRDHQKFGIVSGGSVIYLVEPAWTSPEWTPADWNGPATVGPVSLGSSFAAGDEIQLAVMTSGSPLGTDPGTVFFSGPGFRNPDGGEHDSIT